MEVFAPDINPYGWARKRPDNLRAMTLRADLVFLYLGEPPSVPALSKEEAVFLADQVSESILINKAIPRGR